MNLADHAPCVAALVLSRGPACRLPNVDGGRAFAAQFPLGQAGDQIVGCAQGGSAQVGLEDREQVEAWVSSRHLRLSAQSRLAYQSSASGAGLFAAVAYIRAAASRANVPVRLVCQELAHQAGPRPR